MDVKVVVCGELPGSVALLEQLFLDWDGLDGVYAQIAAAGGCAEMLTDVRAGLQEADGVIVTPGDWADLESVATLRGSQRIIAVGLDDAETADGGASAAWGVPVIRGRGLDGFRWAVAWLRQRLAYPFNELAYGDHPDQIADLRFPENVDEPVPIAVLLHGGFWRERWVRDTIEPIAIDLARRGFATLNVEYRRVRDGFPGWRQTAADVARAIDRLATVNDQLDLSRVALVGHSAGAQLAAWAIKRRGVPTGMRRVEPRAVVLLAGLMDLEEAARRGLGDTGNPTTSFLGGTKIDRSDDYQCASPRTNLPLGVPQIIVQGRRDSPDLVDSARAYAESARAAGDEALYLEFEDADHFSLITPSSREWDATVAAIDEVLAVQSDSP
jgi:acetyl esterase/lipase